MRLCRKGRIFVFKKRSFFEKPSVLSIFVAAEATDMDDFALEASERLKKEREREKLKLGLGKFYLEQQFCSFAKDIHFLIVFSSYSYL